MTCVNNLQYNNGILHHTTAYHHQSNGQIERTHRTLWDLLRTKVVENHRDWDQFIEDVLWALRVTSHTALNISPFEALYERSPQMNIDREFPTKVQPRLQDVKHFQKYMTSMKKGYDYRNSAKVSPILIGQSVWLKHPTIKQKRCQKLLPTHKGPFVVVKKQGPCSYFIKDVDGIQVKVHRNQLIPTDMVPDGQLRRRGRPTRDV